MLIKENGQIIQEKNRSGKSDCMMYGMLSVLMMVLLAVVPQALSAEGTRDMNLISYVGILFGGEIIFIAHTIASYDKYWLKYEICEDGLWTKFPLDKEKLIPWDEFQEVCVCYANRRLLNDNWQGYVVIGLIKHGSMKTMYGRWHTDGIFNYRNVITIDYTYELYEEIMKKCPLGIVDLRDTPEYSLDRTVQDQNTLFK